MGLVLPSPAGWNLIDRRRFLSDMATGLGGIALTSLLQTDPVQEDEPDPMHIDAKRPLAPRPPHFAPKATRVIHIFCTGAVSHLDTWDYKPELEKRHGQPLPGVEKLVTLQGENGNLANSPCPFRPRGQCGKTISDLLPNLAKLADK